MSYGQLQMKVGSTHETMRKHYQRDLESEKVYQDTADQYIALCVEENRLADGISYFLKLSDGTNAYTLCLRADAAELVRGFAQTAHYTGAKAEKISAYLDLLEAKGVTRQMLKTSFGICSTAIFGDDPSLFARGIAWGEISVSDQTGPNHQFIQAINKCRPLCRDRLIALLSEAVRNPEKAQALKDVADEYQMPQAKVYLLLQTLGVELSPKQDNDLVEAIKFAEISNHARLALTSKSLTAEQVLALTVTLD